MVTINNINTTSLRGLLLFFIDEAVNRKPFACKTELFTNPMIEKCVVTIGHPLQLYPGGILTRHLYPELRKYFKNKESDVTLGSFYNNKFAMWIDTRSTTDNDIHGNGLTINNSSHLSD